jgi:hypothetical protein
MAKKITKKSRKSTAPKTRNHNTWSESEYFSRVRSALRSRFRFWIPMQKALEKVSRPSQSINKRIKKEYQCAHCKEWFKRADVQIDHIEECGALNCYNDIVPFLKRLTKENINAYQILCKNDHKQKTKLYIKNKKHK